MKILCIQLKQLGDVIMTTAAIRALSEHYPGCQIDFVTQKPANTVFDHSPYVNHVYCVKWKLKELLPLLTRINRVDYDLLIDFSGSSKTAVFSWFTRIKRRIGVQSRKRRWCFTDQVALQDGYAAQGKLSLLSPLGIVDDNSQVDYFTPKDAVAKFRAKAEQMGIDDRLLIAVSPISKREYKVWAAERFAQVCDRLVESYDAQIFFLIGPGESHFAEAVKDHMKHESLPVDDSLTLYEAATLLDRAAMYLGNDNGLMHLSVGRKRPTFGIFGRPKAINWTSPVEIHQSIEYDPGCKSSCHYPECGMECLSGVSVDAVWARLQAFMTLHKIIH
ncbi:MAG: glycosyltransferase family 9 protein [Pseudomonadota bacterium]